MVMRRPFDISTRRRNAMLKSRRDSTERSSARASGDVARMRVRSYDVQLVSVGGSGRRRTVANAGDREILAGSASDRRTGR